MSRHMLARIKRGFGVSRKEVGETKKRERKKNLQEGVQGTKDDLGLFGVGHGLVLDDPL